MSSTISLSPQLYDLVAQRAEKAHITPDALAEHLLRRELGGEDDWREAFEALMRRVHSRTERFSSAEIEADISAATAEVRERRRATHRS